MNNNQLRQCQPNLSYKPPSSEDNLKSQSNSSRASNSVQKSSRPAKRQITKYHSHSPVEPQIAPSQAQESSFHPIVPKAPPHHACDILRPSIRYLNAIEPKNILDLFLTTSLLETVTTNTNSYAAIKWAEKESSEDRALKEVTPGELATWVKIVVCIGVHNSPAIRDCWKHDGLNPIHPICDYMSQRRFEQINCYFYVAPPDVLLNDSTTGKRLWHSKVDPVLKQFRTSSKAYRLISTHLALDECMMCATRYKMPSKPIEHGFKFHVVADHGYVWDFHPVERLRGSLNGSGEDRNESC